MKKLSRVFICLLGSVVFSIGLASCNNILSNSSSDTSIISSEDTSSSSSTSTNGKLDYDMSNIKFEDKTVTYDGNEHTLEITGTLPEGVSVSYTNNKLTEVGSIEATATFMGDYENYNVIPNMTAILTISKANYIMHNVTFEDQTFVYDGKEHILQISGELPKGVSVSYTNNKLTNVGSIEVIASFTGNYKNYNVIPNMTATLTISKATYDMSNVTLKDQKFLYDGKEHTLQISGELPKGVSVSYTNNKLTNVGSIEVIASFTGDYENYNVIPNMTATLTISNNFDDFKIYTIEGITYKNNGSYLSIIGFDNSIEKNVVIKETLFNKPINTIEENAFYECKNLTSILIPNNVTSIGANAFYGCTNLKTMQLPFIPNGYLGYIFGSPTNLDNYKFVPKTLTEIILNNTLTIDSYAFYRCDSLISITIPSSVKEIGSSAFYGCINLENVYISDISAWVSISFGEGTSNPLNYAQNLYLNNQLVTDLVIPNNVRSIEENAFYGYNNLNSIIIPNNVNEIGFSAFFGCNNLKKIELPTLPQKYLGYIFGASSYIHNDDYVPKSLQEIILTSITNISSNAFYECSSLSSIVIPDSVTEIGDNAFYGCINLQVVKVDNISSWVSISFGSGISNPLYYAHNLQLYSEIATNIIIPEGITSIKPYAFYNCTSLTSITIPNSVTEIGDNAFYGCSNLTSIIIPENVVKIGDNAFYGCSSLTSIIIPENVVKIGVNMLYGCSSLKTLKLPFIPNSYLCSVFGGTSYSDNKLFVPNSLKEVILTNTTTIEASAFDGCSNLISITIPKKVNSIGYDAFYGCLNLENVFIYDISSWVSISFGSGMANPLYYAHNLYLNNELVTNIIIPEGVESINSYAFYGYVNLSSVTLPNSIIKIENSAFYRCSNLKFINIPNNVTHIGYSAFFRCNNLTSITIPENITEIGTNAFYGCDNLKSVFINDLSSWLSISFANSSSNPLFEAHNLYLNNELVTNITIPDGTTSINSYAFYGCSNLTSITIPKSVSMISSESFSKCVNLKDIYYLGSQEEWENISISLNNNELLNATIHFNS